MAGLASTPNPPSSQIRPLRRGGDRRIVAPMPNITTQREPRRKMSKAAKTKDFGGLRTPLGTALTPSQINWLTDYAIDRWRATHSSLSGWRSKMAKFEKRAENDFSDRATNNELRNEETPDNIFFRNNNSLGLSNGFADFAFAQARDDLLGQFPWFQARPEGSDDEQLAADLSKHANWKIRHTNVTNVFTDAVNQSINIGTSFPKITWRRQIEEFERVATVAVGPDGSPVATSAGDPVEADDELVETGDGIAPAKDPSTVLPEGFAWEEHAIPDEVTIFDNVSAALVDYNDIAFNALAPELDIHETDVFHRRSIGLLDARMEFGLTKEQYDAALSVVNDGTDKTGQDTPRTHRGEGEMSTTSYDAEEETNPSLTMIEGYMRCDPFGSGKPIRIYIVFCLELQVTFKLDYLANITPNGVLPILPVRCYRVPGRLIGVGYLERYDEINDFVDSQFNSIIYHDRMASSPPGGYHEDALDEDLDDVDTVELSPNKLWKQRGQRRAEGHPAGEHRHGREASGVARSHPAEMAHRLDQGGPRKGHRIRRPSHLRQPERGGDVRMGRREGDRTRHNQTRRREGTATERLVRHEPDPEHGEAGDRQRGDQPPHAIPPSPGSRKRIGPPALHQGASRPRLQRRGRTAPRAGEQRGRACGIASGRTSAAVPRMDTVRPGRRTAASRNRTSTHATPTHRTMSNFSTTRHGLLNPASSPDTLASFILEVPSGAQVSGLAKIEGWIPVGLLVPAALNGAGNVSFVAHAGVGGAAAVHDVEGNLVAVAPVASTYVVLPPPNFPGFLAFGVATDAAVTADTRFVLVCRKLG